MSWYFGGVYDAAYYKGCLLRTYDDKIFIRFFWKTWNIPYDSITHFNFKKRRIGIEYHHPKLGKWYIELLGMNCNELKCELEKLGKPITYFSVKNK